ncbi:acyl carrier protein [Lachnospiraceae bacterium]|nr:acyl carrier protein [Lachnospiraceae bacterium]
MNNLEKYTSAFVECFGITAEQAKGLTYQAIEEWDSVGHMDLVATIEEKFDIMMDMDDIIDFSSFEKGIELLSKYNVSM